MGSWRATSSGLHRLRLLRPGSLAGACFYRVTHLAFWPTMMGSSSIMYWVLPMTPHMGTPVAASHFLDMLSPVWQPQLLTKAPRAKTRPLIFFSSSSCSHDLQALSMLLL